MIEMNPDIERQIVAWGAAAYPEEGCGLLLGREVDGRRLVTAVFPTANNWPIPAEKGYRFQISPADMLQAELTAVAQGVDVIGVFHSHPDNPPIASPRDLAWAAWPGYSYLITEIRQGEAAVSRSWELRPDRSGFIEEEIILLED